MRDFLERQIAWSKILRAELLEISHRMNASDALNESELVEITEQSDRSAKQSRVLQEEFSALRREWGDSETITPAEREDIRALGKEARVLSDELATLYTQNSEDAQRRASAQRGEMTKMKRLSSSLHKYRTDDDPDLSFLDKKA